MPSNSSSQGTAQADSEPGYAKPQAFVGGTPPVVTEAEYDFLEAEVAARDHERAKRTHVKCFDGPAESEEETG